MAMTKNIHAFEHIRKVLDAVLQYETADYRLPDPKAAMRWRAEAYHFRRLAQAQGIMKYDQLLLQLSGEVVIISRRKVEGVLTVGAKGLAPKEEEVPEEVEDFAFNFAKKLGLETKDEE